MSDCIFCQIVAGEIKTDFLYNDNEIVAFRDINPQAPLHILIIPKKHIPSISGISEEDQILIGKIHFVIQKIVKTEKKTENGFRVICNCGPDAGQAVDHLHFHLLAGREFLWPPG